MSATPVRLTKSMFTAVRRHDAEARVSLAKRRIWHADPPAGAEKPQGAASDTGTDKVKQTPPAAESKALPDGAPDWITDHEKTWKYIKKLRKENGDQRVAKNKEVEAAEPPSTDERVAALERQLKESELKRMRVEIAAELGLPKAVADRLRGETEDDLREDAESLKTLFPPVPEKKDAQGEGDGKEKPKSGTSAGMQQQTVTVPGVPPAGAETDAQRSARLFGGQRNAFSGGTVRYNGSADDLNAPVG